MAHQQQQQDMQTYPKTSQLLFIEILQLAAVDIVGQHVLHHVTWQLLHAYTRAPREWHGHEVDSNSPRSHAMTISASQSSTGTNKGPRCPKPIVSQHVEYTTWSPTRHTDACVAAADGVGMWRMLLHLGASVFPRRHSVATWLRRDFCTSCAT